MDTLVKINLNDIENWGISFYAYFKHFYSLLYNKSEVDVYYLIRKTNNFTYLGIYKMFC